MCLDILCRKRLNKMSHMRIWGKSMGKRILIGSMLVLTLLLLMPSIPAIQQKTIVEGFISKAGQLSTKDEDCGCEDESTVDFEDNPIICGILLSLFGIMVIRINLFLFPLLNILEENGNVILSYLLQLRMIPIQVIGMICWILFIIPFMCIDIPPY